MTGSHPGWDADFLIIGSGFGGAVSALRLAQKGYSVVVLEQGLRWRPEDFPRTNWSLRRYLWAPRLGLHGIQVLSFLRHTLVLHGRGVGGGSLVYANTLVTPRKEVFGRPEWGPGGGTWWQDLAPHYAEARRMLGATPCDGVGRTDELLRDAARDLIGEDRFHVHEVGVWFGEAGRTVPDPYFGGAGPDRTGCTRCGACMIGCRVGAKNTLDRNYLHLAERHGVRIVPDTEARAIRSVDGGYAVECRRATGLFRSRRTWRAPQVVVSGGVMGTVPLLLRSRSSGGLPGLSAELGRVVRTNSESILTAEARGNATDWSDHVAITSGVQVDDRTHIEMVRYNRGSDALFWLTAPLVDPDGALPRPLRALGALLRRPARLLRWLWPFGRAARTGIVLAMQTTDGHLDFGLRRRWWRLGGRSLASSLPAGQQPPVTAIPVANQLARLVAGRMHGEAWSTFPDLFGAPTTAHILGGCRIGTGPASGVVDSAGRVFGCPGLRVADGSVIPVNLGVNPSLTITALAEYFMAQVPPAGTGTTETAWPC